MSTRDRLRALEAQPQHQQPHLWIVDDGDQHDGPPVSELVTAPNGFRVRYGHCLPGESALDFLARVGFDASQMTVVHLPTQHGYSPEPQA